MRLRQRLPQPLVERRLDRLRLLQALRNLLRVRPNDTDETNEARQILENAANADAEYASMARWLPTGPR